MSDYEKTLYAIRGIVDTYYVQAHPLPALMHMRRELTGHLFYLTSHVKPAFKRKEISAVQRKWQMSREIVVALQNDLKAGGKSTPMNKIEVQAEALDFVLQAKKEEAEAAASWEEVKETIRTVHAVLQAMSQEIAHGRKENEYAGYLDGLTERTTEHEQP
jgi:hypothetical protein